MPEKWILTDVTDAERAKADALGGDLYGNMGVGEAIQSLDQGVYKVKPSNRRTVHFLLPGSQRPATRFVVEDEGSMVVEPTAQGYGVGCEDGQLSDGTFPSGCGSVTPYQQRAQNLADISMMDGASEEVSSFPLLAGHDPEIEANMPAQTTGDFGMMADATGPNLQPISDADDALARDFLSVGDQGPITDLSYSAEKHGKNIVMAGVAEEISKSGISFPEPDQPTEIHGEEVTMRKSPRPAPSTLSLGLTEGKPAVDSAAESRDLIEDMDMSDISENMNEQGWSKQQQTDATLVARFHEPSFACEQSTLVHQHVDAATSIKSPKRLLHGDNEQSLAKRQRDEVAPKSESSNEAAPRREARLTFNGDLGTTERAHPIIIAPPPIPAMTDWSSFTVAKLRKELTKRGLAPGGVKTVLVQRLTDYDAIRAMKEPAVEADDGGLTLAESESAIQAKGKGVE